MTFIKLFMLLHNRHLLILYSLQPTNSSSNESDKLLQSRHMATRLENGLFAPPATASTQLDCCITVRTAYLLEEGGGGNGFLK
jgi:hypothetical protein